MNYIPLRVKTSYSLLTSLNDIKKMISFCKNNNINAIAITDNNMYGVMEFYKECLKSNIKPIIGLELIIDDELFILYAKNYFGYQNLTSCSSLFNMSYASKSFHGSLPALFHKSPERGSRYRKVRIP